MTGRCEQCQPSEWTGTSLSSLVTGRQQQLYNCCMAKARTKLSIVTDRQERLRIWNQRSVPVVLRRTGKGQRLRVRLPFDKANRAWLRNARRTEPEWNSEKRCWEIPKSWFNDFVDRALDHFGRVYIFQPYREQEVCAPACQNALGHECQCSCMGQNHGMGSDGTWFETSEAFATRWGELEIACRLLTKKASL